VTASENLRVIQHAANVCGAYRYRRHTKIWGSLQIGALLRNVRTGPAIPVDSPLTAPSRRSKEVSAKFGYGSLLRLDMTDADPNVGKRRGLTCWLLDTRTLWPGESIAESVCMHLHRVLRKRATLEIRVLPSSISSTDSHVRPGKPLR
jgi:hypothetical protein